MGEGINRSKDGVPQWDGDSRSFQEYEEMALQWEQGIPIHKRYLCGPRLQGELSGIARKYVVGKRHDWLSYAGGVEHLLRHLRSSLGRPQLPELSEYLTKYFRQSRRHKGETMNSYIVRKSELYNRAKQALSRVHQDHRVTNQTRSHRGSNTPAEAYTWHQARHSRWDRLGTLGLTG